MRMALSTWWWLDLPSTLDSWAVAPHPDASITAWCRHFMCWMLIAASGNTFESWDIRGGWLGCLAYPSWLAPLYSYSLPWHLHIVASPSRCLSATIMVESPSEQSCGDYVTIVTSLSGMSSGLCTLWVVVSHYRCQNGHIIALLFNLGLRYGWAVMYLQKHYVTVAYMSPYFISVGCLESWRKAGRLWHVRFVLSSSTMHGYSTVHIPSVCTAWSAVRHRPDRMEWQR